MKMQELGVPMKVLRNLFLSSASASLILVSPLAPAQFTVPNTFVPGTPATAADVNQNFGATAAAINGKQNLVTGSCPAGSAIRGINANGTVVCQQLNFFGGDGGAGDLTISANTDWTTTPPVNINFANITINPGQTLTVPAGMTIRCSGTFTNNGTLSVATGARLASSLTWFNGATEEIYSVGHPGDSFRPAIGGSYSNGTASSVWGGLGGEGIPRGTARSSFDGFRIGGGSGGGWKSNDANGGGLVKVYCTGDIVNNGSGTINANGQSPSLLTGGGAGGIVILASASSVTNAGTINAIGGNGGASYDYGGAGGGGGGGIIVIAAPVISGAGAMNVGGGSGGSTAVQVGQATRYGGGGGGASGGNGGNGSTIPAGSPVTVSAPTSGTAGYVQTIIANPAFLLH